MLEIIVDIIVWLLLMVFTISWGFGVFVFYIIWKLSSIGYNIFPYTNIDNDEDDYYIINKNEKS
jgi:hypothetical protein